MNEIVYMNGKTMGTIFYPMVRNEEIGPYVKGNEQDIIYFDKNASVFKEWKEDTPEIYAQVIESDKKYWKLNRFIKDHEDLDKCSKVLIEHMKPLKDIYTTLISYSNYPNINWLEFANFIKACEIIDTWTPVSTIDRLFIATNVELEDIEENPDRALCRYEFFEVLVRIAG